MVAELGIEVDPTWAVAATGWATNRRGGFVCGDMTRGQSLGIVLGLFAEGRSAAAVDRWLMGEDALPAADHPGQLALR